MVSEFTAPPLPFVGREPRGSAGSGGYKAGPPFQLAAQAAQSVFGLVLGIDARAVS